MSKEIKLIPELRFPEFINEKAWEVKELSELGDLINGLTYSPDDVRESGLLVLRSSNIQNGVIDLNDRVYVRKDIKGRNLSEPNDILVCVRNGSKNLIGKNAIIQEGIPLATHGAFMTVFRSKNPEFLFQLFQTEFYDKQVKADLGATINSINGKNFLKYEFPVPDSPREQQKIASCLSSLDELLAAHNEKLDALKDHKKGLMQNLFPQEGETVPKVRFKEFVNDGDWVEKIFDDILDITRLAGYEYSKYWKEDEKKEIIALRGYNIGKGTLLLHNLGYISNELSLQLNRSKLYRGDIVYPCVGTIGNAVVIEENNKFHIQQNIAKLTPKKDISPYFISQFLMSHLGLREVNKFNATSSQPNVLVGSLRNFKICIPKIGEQQKIASCLSAVDELIKAQVDKIEQLQLHKKGLMQGLFPKIES